MACSFLSFVAVAVFLASCFFSEPAAGEQLLGLPPATTALSFEEGYTQLFGDSNLVLHGDGKRLHISLDERTGSPPLLFLAVRVRWVSSRCSLCSIARRRRVRVPGRVPPRALQRSHQAARRPHRRRRRCLLHVERGRVRADARRAGLRVPGERARAGVAVADQRVRQRQHGGRTGRGYGLWFDPTEDFHQYTILWSSDRIIFYVDETPIREVVKTASMGAQFPSKPMSLYATIWDGSSWATSGGRYKVDYKYAPYVAEFTDLALRGCAVGRPAAACAGAHGVGGADAMSRAAVVDGGVPRAAHDVRVLLRPASVPHAPPRVPRRRGGCGVPPVRRRKGVVAQTRGQATPAARRRGLRPLIVAAGVP